MEITFRNKTVLVTGASRGIGRAIATMFAEAGAQVIIHYNNDQQSAEETLSNIEGKGHMIVQADWDRQHPLRKW